MEENKKFQMSPILQKVINPSKTFLIHQKMIWHKPVLSVEEVTVTFALVTLLDLLFQE